MSSKPPSTVYRDAAHELANEFARRQFRNSITDRDAAEYVTDEVARCWGDAEISGRPVQAVLSDLIFNLTDAEGTALLRALEQQDGIPDLVHLSRVMYAQVAHDLAYEAEQIAENMEPTDEELQANRDYRAEMRSLARQEAAALRTGREAYFDV